MVLSGLYPSDISKPAAQTAGISMRQSLTNLVYNEHVTLRFLDSHDGILYVIFSSSGRTSGDILS